MVETPREVEQEKNNHDKVIFECVYEMKGQLNLIREDLRRQNKNILTLLGIIIGVLLFILAKRF